MKYSITYPKSEICYSCKHNVTFITIFFNDYKANIVVSHAGYMDCSPIVKSAFFRLRTIDNKIIKTVDGNNRTQIKGEYFNLFRTIKTGMNKYNADKNKLENDLATLIGILISQNYIFK